MRLINQQRLAFRDTSIMFEDVFFLGAPQLGGEILGSLILHDAVSINGDALLFTNA